MRRLTRIRAAARAAWQVIRFFLRLPWTLPLALARGVRSYVQDVRAPVDLVAYYSRGHGLRKALANNAVPLATLGIYVLVLTKVCSVAHNNVQTILLLAQNVSAAQVAIALAVGLIPYTAQFLWRMFDSVLAAKRHPRDVLVAFWIAYMGLLLIAATSLSFIWFILLVVYPLITLAVRGIPSDAPSQGSPNTKGEQGVPYRKWMDSRFEDLGLTALAEELRQLVKTLDGLPETEVEQRAKIEADIEGLVQKANERRREVNTVLRRWGILRGLLGAGVVFYLLLAVASPQPWLPREALTIRGHGPQIGYVVAQDTAWTQILLDEPRLVVTVKSSDLAARRPCRTGPTSGIGRSFVQLLNHDRPAAYPECPKA